MPSKFKRQTKLKQILNTYAITSQEQVIKLLRSDDINVTQATLSRDFSDLGVIRKKTEFGIQYVLNPDESGKQIAKLIGYEILSIQHSEYLIVIRTLAGRAQGVAHYIDRLNNPDILGTIGGDDTVLVIPSSKTKMNSVLKFLEKYINTNHE
ncbi:MAG: arginine repressor [Ignavibacteria bacterium]|nr:MAG: arginine repressor [Ignavibacteria bacterium]